MVWNEWAPLRDVNVKFFFGGVVKHWLLNIIATNTFTDWKCLSLVPNYDFLSLSEAQTNRHITLNNMSRIANKQKKRKYDINVFKKLYYTKNKPTNMYRMNENEKKNEIPSVLHFAQFKCVICNIE